MIEFIILDSKMDSLLVYLMSNEGVIVLCKCLDVRILGEGVFVLHTFL